MVSESQEVHPVRKYDWNAARYAHFAFLLFASMDWSLTKFLDRCLDWSLDQLLEQAPCLEFSDVRHEVNHSLLLFIRSCISKMFRVVKMMPICIGCHLRPNVLEQVNDTLQEFNCFSVLSFIIVAQGIGIFGNNCVPDTWPLMLIRSGWPER